MSATASVRAAAAILIALVGVPSAAQSARLSGSVTYRERMALPPSAVVEIRLENVTRAESAPPVVAKMRIDRLPQVPIRFSLDYDAAAIDPRGRYAVRATIFEGKTVLFTSLDTMLVLTQGRGTHADLVLTRVGAPAPPAPVATPVAAAVPAAQAKPAPPLPPNPFTDLPATFAGTLPCADCQGIRYHLNLFGDDSFFLRMTSVGKSGEPVDDLGSWALSSDRRVLILKGRDEHFFAVPAPATLRKLDASAQPFDGKLAYDLKRTSPFRPVDVRATVRGAYTYFADAGAFIECSTGQRWPVAMEAANRDLESAYLKARPSPGASVLVELDGLVTQRRKMEGAGTERSLVVQKVGRVLPKEHCAPRFASAPLADTYWRLTHLGERVTPAASDPRREPSLTFQSDSASFSGSSGCNRLIGTYALDNAAMSLKSGGTMMACKAEAQTEAGFLAALQATHTYRITGRVLELFDEKGTRVARFEARVASGITVR